MKTKRWKIEKYKNDIEIYSNKNVIARIPFNELNVKEAKENAKLISLLPEILESLVMANYLLELHSNLMDEYEVSIFNKIKKLWEQCRRMK